MQRLANSLTFKIGAMIILVEMVVLAGVGIVYTRRFSDEVDRRIEAQAQLPGTLMDAGLLSYDSVADGETMRRLAGEELITGMVVGVNGNVFYSLDPDYLGKNIADVPGVDAGLIDVDSPQAVIVHRNGTVVSVSPIYAADRRTPRFFAYVQVGTVEARAEKVALAWLFVLGSAGTVLLTSAIIIVSFDRVISRRIFDLVSVLERVETGDLTTRVQAPSSRDEIGFLQRSTNAMITARQQTEAQIVHLNRVLRAIRNVNQLITQERDRDRLLERACQRLTETASYASAWILLLDDHGTPAKFIRKDVEGNTLSLTDLLEQAELMACVQAVLAQAGVRIMADGADVCQDCFLLSKRGSPNNMMAIRLEYNGKIYGVLNVTVLTEYAIDAEEVSLFEELAGDISFALYSIGLEVERKRAEEALKAYSERLEEMVDERTRELYESQEQLVEQEKLAVLGQLAGAMAHELRNPLGAVKNAAYLLGMILEKPDPEIVEALKIMKKEIGTSERIIGSLLDYTHDRPPDRREVQVNQVIREALSRASISQGIEVVHRLDEALPAVLADPDQLGRVLSNLISNGIDAMPKGGRLVVSSERAGPDCLAVSVTDTGTGIPEENLEKLFEPLFTTKAKGIGLGLALARKLVEGHGGTIEVESRVGKGSTFTVRLPTGAAGPVKERTHDKR